MGEILKARLSSALERLQGSLRSPPRPRWTPSLRGGSELGSAHDVPPFRKSHLGCGMRCPFFRGDWEGTHSCSNSRLLDRRQGLAGAGFAVSWGEDGQGLNTLPWAVRSPALCSESAFGLLTAPTGLKTSEFVTREGDGVELELMNTFQFISSLKRKACLRRWCRAACLRVCLNASGHKRQKESGRSLGVG